MRHIELESGDSYGVSKHCESSDTLIQLNESKSGDQIRVRFTQVELADLVDSLIDLQNPKPSLRHCILDFLEENEYGNFHTLTSSLCEKGFLFNDIKSEVWHMTAAGLVVFDWEWNITKGDGFGVD